MKIVFPASLLYNIPTSSSSGFKWNDVYRNFFLINVFILPTWQPCKYPLLCKWHYIYWIITTFIITRLSQRGGNGIINKVSLRQSQSVSRLLTFGGRTVQPRYSSRPLGSTQPGHPSAGRCNEYWRRFRPPLGKKRRVLRNSRHRYKSILA